MKSPPWKHYFLFPVAPPFSPRKWHKNNTKKIDIHIQTCSKKEKIKFTSVDEISSAASYFLLFSLFGWFSWRLYNLSLPLSTRPSRFPASMGKHFPFSFPLSERRNDTAPGRPRFARVRVVPCDCPDRTALHAS